MTPNPTDEIRAIKRKLAAACGNDIHRIAEDARRRQHESGRQSAVVPQPTAETEANKNVQLS